MRALPSNQPFKKRLLIYFLPSAAVLSLLLVSTGVIPFNVFAFIFLLNLLVVAAGLKKTNRIHRQVTGVHNYLSSIYQLLKTFDKEAFSSSLLNEVKAEYLREYSFCSCFG